MILRVGLKNIGAGSRGYSPELRASGISWSGALSMRRPNQRSALVRYADEVEALARQFDGLDESRRLYDMAKRMRQDSAVPAVSNRRPATHRGYF